MKIVTLFENTTIDPTLACGHGLSLYVETKTHKLLFDVGRDHRTIENAEKLGIDLSLVDSIVLSHGHKDHTGAIREILDLNKKCKLYMHPSIYGTLTSHGVDISMPSIEDYDNEIIYVEDCISFDEISLFKNKVTSGFKPEMNKSLFCNNRQDTFDHEIGMIVDDEKITVFTGCSHSGITNMVNTARNLKMKPVGMVIGGMHLYSHRQNTYDSHLDQLVNELKGFRGTLFYTGHCTGSEGMTYLSEHLDLIYPLSTGLTI